MLFSGDSTRLKMMRLVWVQDAKVNKGVFRSPDLFSNLAGDTRQGNVHALERAPIRALTRRSTHRSIQASSSICLRGMIEARGNAGTG